MKEKRPHLSSRTWRLSLLSGLLLLAVFLLPLGFPGKDPVQARSSRSWRAEVFLQEDYEEYEKRRVLLNRTSQVRSSQPAQISELILSDSADSVQRELFDSIRTGDVLTVARESSEQPKLAELGTATPTLVLGEGEYTIENIQDSDLRRILSQQEGVEKRSLVTVILTFDGYGALTPQHIKNRLFLDQDSTAEAFRRASYGAIEIDGDKDQDGEFDVFGPYDISELTQAEDFDICEGMFHLYEPIWKIVREQEGVELSDWDLQTFFMPPGFRCRWIGLGGIGCLGMDKCTSVHIATATKRVFASTIAHELGHNFGFGHSGSDTFVESSGYQYGDKTCFMGGAALPAELNAIQRHHRGWLSDKPIPDASEGGTYRISSLHLAPGEAQYPQILNLKRGDGQEPYFVSYRVTAEGTLDFNLSPFYTSNLYVHYPEYVGRTSVLVKVLQGDWGVALPEGYFLRQVATHEDYVEVLIDSSCRENLEGACCNGIDDDQDGLTDLEDTECLDSLDPSEDGPSTECSNGIDDDGDGKIDLFDSGCIGQNDTSEDGVPNECFNGIDDDGDGKTDGFDPGCEWGRHDNSEYNPVATVTNRDGCQI